MDQQGNLVFTENLDDQQLQSDPEVLLADMHIMMHEKATSQEAVATAVVSQVKVENPQLNGSLQSALNVSIDYQDGSTFDCFLPFEAIEKNTFNYGQIFSKGGDSDKFNK